MLLATEFYSYGRFEWLRDGRSVHPPPPPMNKAELVLIVQKTLGENVTKVQAERALVSVIESIKIGLEEDKAVQLVGFGSFKVFTRKARFGVNPNTRKRMKIKASKAIRFTAGKDLKTRIASPVSR
jgi:DNA-binding protein HU-beta